MELDSFNLKLMRAMLYVKMTYIFCLNNYLKFCYNSKSLLTNFRKKHSLEIEVMPPHMTFMPHYIDFS